MNIVNILKVIILKPKNFFFSNLGIRQTILKNTFWLAVADGISQVFRLVLVIYAARILGANSYGEFTFAFAFVSIFLFFSDFGLSQIVSREFSSDDEREKQFSDVLSLKLILSLGSIILVLISSFFITTEPSIREMVWVLGTFVIAENYLAVIFSFFQAKQKMEYQALAKTFEAVLILIIGFLIITNFPSAKNLSYAYLIAGLASLIFILFFFHFKIYRLRLSFDRKIWANFIIMSWPLGLAIFFRSIYNQIDSVMMGYFGQIIQTGWYNAAYKVINATIIPLSLISVSFFPLLNKFFNKSVKEFQIAWDYYIGVMVFLVVPMMVGGITLSSKIVDFTYGPDYSFSVGVLKILFITTGIFSIFFPLSHILIITGNQKKLLWVTFVGALVNIILNLFLIPVYSLYGASVATVITLLLIIFLLFMFVRKIAIVKFFNLNIFINLCGAIISSVIMYLIISRSTIYNLNIIFSTLIGIIVYSFVFIVFNKIINKYKIKIN